jgi:hypothetical protein
VSSFILRDDPKFSPDMTDEEFAAEINRVLDPRTKGSIESGYKPYTVEEVKQRDEFFREMGLLVDSSTVDYNKLINGIK